MATQSLQERARKPNRRAGWPFLEESSKLLPSRFTKTATSHAMLYVTNQWKDHCVELGVLLELSETSGALSVAFLLMRAQWLVGSNCSFGSTLSLWELKSTSQCALTEGKATLNAPQVPENSNSPQGSRNDTSIHLL